MPLLGLEEHNISSFMVASYFCSHEISNSTLMPLEMLSEPSIA